jgi:hypothetical protein
LALPERAGAAGSGEDAAAGTCARMNRRRPERKFELQKFTTFDESRLGNFMSRTAELVESGERRVWNIIE